jgi:hypothetical protein
MATAKKKPGKTTTRKPGKAALAVETGKGALSLLEQRFSAEYIKDMNGTKAYLRVKPNAKATTAATEASKLLGKPKIQDEIARRRDAAAAAAGITARKVIEHAWGVMVADPRELVSFRVGCCRHCWGLNYRYQRTDGELADDAARHKLEVARAGTDAQRRKLGTFDKQGGGGFDVRRDANPDCPSCGGMGQGRAVMHDTRAISDNAAMLYAGVEETKEGVKVKLQSKEAARTDLMRHFGLYRDKLELTMPTVRIKDMTGRKRPAQGATEE